MNHKYLGIAALTLASAVLATAQVAADSPSAASGGAGDGTLQRPQDLRELVFLSSGYGMAYGPAADKARDTGGVSPFTNVFVSPAAYRNFMQTGKWQEGTTFFLEVRHGVGHASIASTGSSQGALIAIEAEKKDSALYPDGGFAFFDFGPGGSNVRAQPLPHTATCYACHSKNGAVEWTFTQFYPEPFAVAQRLGTVRKDYDPDRKLK
ncbi:MAG: cytochrome P460 family protein [Steroidobacteraceae bacterium]